MWIERSPDGIRAIFSEEGIQQLIEDVGPWGPVFLMGMMVTAIVASPVPSAPIALVAGAAYGHFWGTAIIVAGAQTGAVIAFGLSRWLGREALERRLGLRLDRGWLGSQRTLMWGVFASRLMPFISFDLISYAAGLTSISASRFFVATLAGIVPASFLLAHFGGELTGGLSSGAAIAVLGIGLLTGAPLIWNVVQRSTRRERSGTAGSTEGRAGP